MASEITGPSAKERTPAEIREERNETLIALAIAILVIGAIAFFIWRSVTALPPAPDRVDMPVANAPALGDADSPVVVVVFSDFECPFCGEFARDAFPEIKASLIETGKVRFAFRHFPLATHPHAPRAAQAAACAAGQGKFWEYHDGLYADQDRLEIGQLQALARELDLDTARFDTCLLGEERAVVVAQDRALGLQAGVSGTPTFFFNGRKVAGSLSATEFAAEVEKELSAPAEG